MLLRRQRHGVLALGLLPKDQRGSLDDLHAWVEMRDEILIGDNGSRYRTLARFGRLEPLKAPISAIMEGHLTP
jgi:hypothetical protein